MKIVSLLGSPRPNSNSSAIANRFLKTAQELGAETTCFTLNRLNYRGCQGCYVCKTTLDHCVLRDDLAQVLDAVAEADLVVLASPVYYGEVTSQLKGFLDRTFSYLVPDYRTSATPTRLSPKKLVFVQTQGHPDEEMFADIFQRYEHFLKWTGFTEATLIRACGIGPGSVDAPPEEALREAEAVARRLVS
ncbi:FMN reductase [Geomonas silvestris]|uniref:FMN reductase n=1 Tax=Geomonas silvestris TaxID=2740184 RepID=A0A6V8ME43_9BACT|nr:flavodoxin family protein [Geomonas silvestris]GFO58241.1 FMN reductase [Geomonas silvestris]